MQTNPNILTSFDHLSETAMHLFSFMSTTHIKELLPCLRRTDFHHLAFKAYIILSLFELTIFFKDAVWLNEIQRNMPWSLLNVSTSNSCGIVFFYASKPTQITVNTGTTTSEWNEMTGKFVNQVASSYYSIFFFFIYS